MEKEIDVRVSEAFQQDVGFGRARIDNQIREKLDLELGDVIEIRGTKTTAAVVWKAHQMDEGKKRIRIDNLTRKNAGTGLDESVKIKRISIKEAKKIVLAPNVEGENIHFAGDTEGVIKRGLLKRPLKKGDVVVLPDITFFGNVLPLIVVDSKPKGITFVTESTVIELGEIAQAEEMFSFITDKDGNPLSEKELMEMDVEDHILLLRGCLKKMDYLKEEDRRILAYLTGHLLRSFQESRSYKKKKVKHGKKTRHR